jgi:hypothetical protein
VCGVGLGRGIRAAVNIGRWAKAVLESNTLLPLAYDLNIPTRNERREITLTVQGVIKVLINLEDAQRDWLVQFYSHIATQRVNSFAGAIPHMEWASRVTSERGKVKLVLHPLGYLRPPRTFDELRAALRAVLTWQCTHSGGLIWMSGGPTLWVTMTPGC